MNTTDWSDRLRALQDSVPVWLGSSLKYLALIALCLGLLSLTACGTASSPTIAPLPSPSLTAPTPVFIDPTMNPVRADRDRLMQRLTDFSQPRFDDSERDQARQYLATRLSDRGWSVQREAFTIPRDDAPELNGVNLIVERAGSDPTLPPLLIGAHYDSVNNSPGADDNASAAIALLEIAELLGDPAIELTRSLRLVWFDLEEFGLLGSFYHVAQLVGDDSLAAPPVESSPPDTEPVLYGAIVLEMLGYTCDTPGCQYVPPGLAITLPDRGDFLGVVGNAEAPELLSPFVVMGESPVVERDLLGHPPVVTLAVPTRLAIAPNLLRSDHVPFWAQGIGALMVTDTANFRNPHYHRRSDTVETIDPEFLTRSTQVVLDAALVLLNR